MGQERREYRTPFTYQAANSEHYALLASDGTPIALFHAGEPLVRFICRACNRYDMLMAAFDLCRGHFDNMTLPATFPNDKAFSTLSKQLHEHIERFGR